MSAKKLLMGNEAFAHAALEAGVRVVAGYPGTPSSELIETIARLHAAGKAHGVHVEWSTNEKAALELLAGASYAGARCLFTCKQVGLNVASDALMSLNYVGIKGGLVLFVADDPGPISSQTEQDTRRFAAFAKVPVLDPSTPEDGFAMMKAAFELSERFCTPVIVRPTTRINHASTFFEVADETSARDIPEEGFVRDPKWVIFPKRAYEAHGEINSRLQQMATLFSEEEPYVGFNPVEVCTNTRASLRMEAGSENQAAVCGDTGDGESGVQPTLGIVASGVSAAYAHEALRLIQKRLQKNENAKPFESNLATSTNNVPQLPPYKFLQIGTPYPLPEKRVETFLEGLTDVLVLEELDYVLEDELFKLCGKKGINLRIHGKLDGSVKDRGENSVDSVLTSLANFMGVDEALVAPSVAGSTALDASHLPVRPPVLCPGCPHRGSFYVVKKALGKTPAVLCGDIGCYTLGNAMPLDAVDTCLCMGAGITMAQGFSVAEPQKKTVAFVGDSTFFASGLPGVVNAVYNGHNITLCVLDNATTAMTGSQPHPGTGQTLMGPKNEPVSIEAVLTACGVKCIVHANPLNLGEAKQAAQTALDYQGVSAILFESPCIQLKKPDVPVQVDAAKCTGCKRCITEIGCPALVFNLSAGKRGQADVDPSLCNGCGLCTQLCAFNALVVDEGGEGASHV